MNNILIWARVDVGLYLSQTFKIATLMKYSIQVDENHSLLTKEC